MSIDNIFYARSGCKERNAGERFMAVERYTTPRGTEVPYTVRLNHGGGVMVDELFLFDDEDDALWFIAEGYRGMLYELESEPDDMYLERTC